MRAVVPALFSLSVLAACGGGGGSGGSIERACLQSDRSAATRSRCACIGRVASQSLSRSDRNRAAEFFTNPDRAQETRARDDALSEAFWLRYKEFADKAARSCG